MWQLGWVVDFGVVGFDVEVTKLAVRLPLGLAAVVVGVGLVLLRRWWFLVIMAVVLVPEILRLVVKAVWHFVLKLVLVLGTGVGVVEVCMRPFAPNWMPAKQAERWC